MSEAVTIIPVCTSVGTVLGDSRPVTRHWADGSAQCPFCTSPIIYPKTSCENPWCDAHPSWTPAALATRREEQEAKERQTRRDEETRRSVREAARIRAEEHKKWEQEQIVECRRRGACERCLFQPGWERVKFIKHRGACPKR